LANKQEQPNQEDKLAVHDRQSQNKIKEAVPDILSRTGY